MPFHCHIFFLNVNIHFKEGENEAQEPKQNPRDAIMEMQMKIEHAQLMNGGKKSKAWNVLKQKLVTAKVEEALTSPKVFINGKKFTILRLLGEGGYSCVYEVYDTNKKLYALKIVDLSIHSDSVRQDLIREIVFLEKLKACNLVVKAYDYELRETESEYKIFVLMEKGDRDLFQIMNEHRNNKTLSPAKLRYFWEQMLEAVQQVHSLNIVHADLKPGNFLLVQGNLKVIDFGMAIEITPGSDYVLRQFIGGTKEYMSPETMAGYIIEEGAIDQEAMKKRGGVQVSPKSDVWALGIILYQTVYGVLPFASVPGGKLAKIKVIGDPNIPVEFENVKNLNPLLLDTMKRCLEKSVDKRASIEELLVHPYLRPDHDAEELPVLRVCKNCKTREKQMARLTKKRLNAFKDL